MHDTAAADLQFERFREQLAAGEVSSPLDGWSPCQPPCAECRDDLKLRIEELIFDACRRGTGPTALDFARDERIRTWLSDEDFRELLAVENRCRREKLQSMLTPAQESTLTQQRDDSAGRLPPAISEFADWQFIGQGAMGEVWRARHKELARVEAIKVARIDHAEVGMAERLRLEGRALGELRHPNICRLYDIDQTRDGRWYLRMDYIDGPDLRQWRLEQSRPVKLRVLTELVAGLARGIEAAHERGIIHRDIKPSNILVTEREGKTSFLLTDFGLAKYVDALSERSTITLAGTPRYWSPEQAAAKEVSPGSDVFSLGVVLYELVCGKLPFDAHGEEYLRKVRRGDLERPRSAEPLVSQDLEAVIVKSLAHDPQDRYRTMGEMAADLEAVSRGEFPLNARMTSTWRRVLRKVRRHPALAAGVAIVVCLAVSLLLVWTNAQQVAREQALTFHRQAIEDALDTSAMFSDEAWSTVLDHATECAQLDRVAGVSAFEDIADFLLHSAHTNLHSFNRLKLSVERLSRLSTAASARLQRRVAELDRTWQDRLQRYRQAMPYAHSGSLFHLMKPDRQRARELEKIAYEQEDDDPFSFGTRHELLRIYLADGDHFNAARSAQSLLDRRALPPAWRLNIARDWVWLLIERADRSEMELAIAQIDQWLKDGTRLSAAGSPEPTFPEDLLLGLWVERAQLHVALQDWASAEADVDRFFRAIDYDALGSRFLADSSGLETGEPVDNIRGLMFLDASLLWGFLLERRGASDDARAAWSEAFGRVRESPVGTYYEAAVLGSLCEEISQADAERMVTRTIAKADEDSENEGLNIFREKLHAGLGFLAVVLRESWSSPAGREAARRIAFREMSFGDFTRAQAKRWLTVALSHAISGSSDGKLSTQIDQAQADFIEACIAEVERAYLAGELSDISIAATLAVALGGDEGRSARLALRLPGLTHPRDLRGKFAYVMGRHYGLNLHDPTGARSFLEEAARYAATDPLLSKLLSAELAETTIAPPPGIDANDSR